MFYDRKSFFPNIFHYSSSKDRALALYPTFPSPTTSGYSQNYRDVTIGHWDLGIAEARSTKSCLKGVGRGQQQWCGIRSSVKREVSTSCVVVVDCNNTPPNLKLILMELYQAPRLRQRLTLLLEIFTFGVSRGLIYIIRGGKKLSVDLVLHWAGVEAMERVSRTAGLGELGKYN